MDSLTLTLEVRIHLTGMGGLEALVLHPQQLDTTIPTLAHQKCAMFLLHGHNTTINRPALVERVIIVDIRLPQARRR